MVEGTKSSPEFIMRVKLPPETVVPPGDFDLKRQAALFESLPEGFEICYERPGFEWPKDSEGYSFIRIQPVRADAVQNEYYRLQQENQRLIKNIKEINRLSRNF